MNDRDRAKDLFFKGLECLENREFFGAEQFFLETLKLAPQSVPTLNNLALAQYAQGKTNDAALSAHKVLAIDLNNVDAYLMVSTCQKEQERYDEAIQSCQKIISIDPTIVEAHYDLGYALNKKQRYKEAIASFDRALALKPHFAEAWLGRGDVFAQLRQYNETLAAYRKALTLKPDLATIEGWCLYCKMHLCDWSNFNADCEHLISSVKNNKTIAHPFVFIPFSSSRDDQLECAKLWTSENYPTVSKPIWNGEIYSHDKVHVGYVSADFRQHATSYLMAGMFECHDKTQFEITAISIGPDDGSELRNRLKNASDCFFDGRLLSDDEIAHRIKQKEIDILVDLNGFTQDARTGIFALRAAPIQVNYLGYPGTMGAKFIDYIIAGETLVPQSHQQDYREKIVYLPNTYQANDTKRAISEKVISREKMGLPRGGFVFCCFNDNYKIVPEVFDCWMRIIKKVKGSVLWLLESSEFATRNLRMEANARGIDPERLVFAKKVPAADHLTRHRLADLFLDTLPYNAHTTASDALWAGLPVLTRIGESFAGRVAASLLNAIGLTELITSTSQDYEALAIELATNPEKLGAIKRNLATNRLTTPLFDTQLFTRHIEAAYTAMIERYQANQTPDHIYVSP